MSIDLEAVAEAALRRPVTSAAVETRTAIAYDPYLPGRVVERVTGVAETADGARAEWTAILKRTEGPGLRSGRRELAAYRDGVASATPHTGLRAPALYGWDDGADRAEVWLEPVRDVHGGRWAPERFGVAARHIAAWDARASRMPLPPGFDSEDAWAERHGQPDRVAEVVAELRVLREPAAAAEVMGLLDDPGFRRTEALIASTAARIDTLATFPQTPLHHDLVRSNLFALGDDATAAIDWENVGRGPLGVDLAPLVVGSVRRGEASADDLARLEGLVLDGYVDGLRNEGLDAERDVRHAYRLAVGLRWHVVLGAITTWLDPHATRIRGSRPEEARSDGLRHLVLVARHILDTADSPAG